MPDEKKHIQSLKARALPEDVAGLGRRKLLQLLLLLVAILPLSSCVVRPSCFRWTFFDLSPPKIANIGQLAQILVYAGPIDAPPSNTHAPGAGLLERFDRGTIIIIDASGSMMVRDMRSWPERCPTIAPADLSEASVALQPLLERAVRDHTRYHVMEHPYTGEDWRAYGPLISISFGSTSGKTVGLLWDGRVSLPEDLDSAVIASLELACSNSKLAKEYLLRDLPQQVASRLEC